MNTAAKSKERSDRMCFVCGTRYVNVTHEAEGRIVIYPSFVKEQYSELNCLIKRLAMRLLKLVTTARIRPCFIDKFGASFSVAVKNGDKTVFKAVNYSISKGVFCSDFYLLRKVGLSRVSIKKLVVKEKGDKLIDSTLTYFGDYVFVTVYNACTKDMNSFKIKCKKQLK